MKPLEREGRTRAVVHNRSIPARSFPSMRTEASMLNPPEPRQLSMPLASASSSRPWMRK